MQQIQTLWPEWKVVEKIGQGTYGTVYKIEKHDMLGTEQAALKVISLPRSEDDLHMLRHSGMDAQTVSRTLEKQVGNILQEYKLMRALRDVPGVVHCDNYGYVPRANGLGWEIHIQMELLNPFLRQKKLIRDEADIIRFAMELCRTLDACHSYGIIHRDIKPHNIFLTDDGRYKLGDFGIARFAEGTATATMGAGTLSFMAPEVFNGSRYSHSVDLYSLGMVLYWLLNERLAPFVAQGELPENANYKRFRGEPLPPPKNGSAELKQIVLKACAFDPKDRYPSAGAMLEALEGLPAASSRGFEDLSDDTEPESDGTVLLVSGTNADTTYLNTVLLTPTPDKPRKPEDPPRREPAKKAARGKKTAFLVCIGLLLLILMLSFFGKSGDAPDALTAPGFVEFGGRYYALLDTPLESYAEAAAFCRELGGHMADANSEEENRFFHEFLSDNGYTFVYLGGNDAREDGIWEWESGEPFAYQNWNVGEPNNDLGGEDHLAMYQFLTDGSWNDLTYAAPACLDAPAQVLGVRASSYCTAPQKRCSADHLVDDDPTTSWCTAESDSGIGESVLFEFRKKERLTGIAIHTGNQADAQSFEGSHRPRSIRLIFDDGTSETFELQDGTGEQYIPFDKVIVTASVKLVLDSAYESDHGKGIAISEVLFHSEGQKSGFLCEWKDEASARAAAAKLAESAT